MLDIIQMAFGDLQKFNESVRSILHAIDWMRTCPREWLATSPTPAGSPVPSPLSPGIRFPVPDDSPIPSIPSPKKRAPLPLTNGLNGLSGLNGLNGLNGKASPAASPARVLPEDSPIPSMPSPKQYQWLN